MEQVLAAPVGVLSGEQLMTGAVGARLVKVIVTLLDAGEVPPCPSAAVAVAVAVPGVVRLYVVLVPVALPVRPVADHV